MAVEHQLCTTFFHSDGKSLFRTTRQRGEPFSDKLSSSYELIVREDFTQDEIDKFEQWLRNLLQQHGIVCNRLQFDAVLEDGGVNFAIFGDPKLETALKSLPEFRDLIIFSELEDEESLF